MSWEQLVISAAAVLGVGLLRKVDKVYDCLVGTTQRAGIVDRMRRVEDVLGLDDAAPPVRRPFDTHRAD